MPRVVTPGGFHRPDAMPRPAGDILAPALTATKAGRLAAAEQLARQAIPVAEARARQDGGAALADVHSMLGLLAAMQGRLPDAIAEYETAAAGFARALGEEAVETQEVRHNLELLRQE